MPVVRYFLNKILPSSSIVSLFIFLNGISAQNVNDIVKADRFAGIDLSIKEDNHIYFKVIEASCDTIFSIAARHIPSGLTWDGQYLWNVDAFFIYKINSSGSYMDSISNPAIDTTNYKAGDLCFDGASLWYADEESAQLFEINPTNGNVIQQFNLPSFGQSDPNGFGLAWDGQNLWHNQYLPRMIYKINPTNGSVHICPKRSKNS